MYKVRVKKFEKRSWNVVAEFDTFKEAERFAIKLDFANRKNPDTMYDHIEVKWCSNLVTRKDERYTIA